jgi:hypothetical protein
MPFVFLVFVAATAAPARADTPAAIEARLAETARFLSSDELEGRGLGTKGLDLAGDYIARRFQELRLRTDICQGGPVQKFTVAIDAELTGENRLTLVGPPSVPGGKPETVALALGIDFTPLAISGSQTFDLPLVFAGYGITARSSNYDDYADMDVTGKAVIVLRHQPREGIEDRDSAGLKDTAYTLFRSKASNAYEHGAAAIIFCNDYALIRGRRAQDDRVASFHAAGTTHTHPDLPVAHCRREPLDKAVRAVCGEDMARLEAAIDGGLKPRSRELTGWRVVGRTEIRNVPCEVKNIVAELPAEGPNAQEAIVLGAHYDHLGYGSRSSLPSKPREVYSGADDNASGVAVMLEVARALAQRPQKLGRRVVFAAFTGEEWGFFGSSHYVNHPPVPLEKTVAMINLDMVGRLREDKVTVNCTATAAVFDGLLDQVHAPHALKLLKVPRASGRSDQAAFYAKKVPVLHFFTGKHPEYHRPTDKFALLNVPGMRRIAALLTDLIVAMADSPVRPEYVAVPPQPRSGDQPPPFFGSIADFTREEPGCAISGVVPGSPAQRGGLVAGDVIVRFGRSKIGNVYDFDGALRKCIAGERVRVLVRRGSASVALSVTLDPPQ